MTTSRSDLLSSPTRLATFVYYPPARSYPTAHRCLHRTAIPTFERSFNALPAQLRPIPWGCLASNPKSAQRCGRPQRTRHWDLQFSNSTRRRDINVWWRTNTSSCAWLEIADFEPQGRDCSRTQMGVALCWWTASIERTM